MLGVCATTIIYLADVAMPSKRSRKGRARKPACCP